MLFNCLKCFAVLLDYPEPTLLPVFSLSKSVADRVMLELSGEAWLCTLHLHARGCAQVHLTESRLAGSSTIYTQSYGNHVDFLNHRQQLLTTPPDSGKVMALPTGPPPVPTFAAASSSSSCRSG
ncbi:UNVERIFIED_CONTAM: hypothetical protein K2H54_057673 [Gekko kuhli]